MSQLCNRALLTYSVDVMASVFSQTRTRGSRLLQAASHRSVMPRPRSLLRDGLRLVLAMLLLLGGMASAAGQPTAAMLKPVQALAAFMSTLPPHQAPEVFTPTGLCIIENFAPYIFCGRDAAARWESGFRAHAADLRDLTASFGDAFDFDRMGRRVYFSLPTKWTGLSAGRHFEEHRAWAFVLERTRAGGPEAWRIKGYGWAVHAYTEDPPP